MKINRFFDTGHLYSFPQFAGGLTGGKIGRFITNGEQIHSNSHRKKINLLLFWKNSGIEMKVYIQYGTSFAMFSRIIVEEVRNEMEEKS